MPSAEQLEARAAAKEARREEIKRMLLAHDWRSQGETKGYQHTYLPRGVPDRPENMVTEIRGAGQWMFRRGEQYSRVGLIYTTLWRFDGRTFRDRLQIKNTDLAKIQQVLHERSPRKE